MKGFFTASTWPSGRVQWQFLQHIGPRACVLITVCCSWSTLALSSWVLISLGWGWGASGSVAGLLNWSAKLLGGLKCLESNLSWNATFKFPISNSVGWVEQQVNKIILERHSCGKGCGLGIMENVGGIWELIWQDDRLPFLYSVLIPH